MIHSNLCQKQIETPEFVKKVRLENRFIPELRSIFAQILRDYRVSIRAIGQIPDVSQYRPTFKVALVKQYSRVQTAFKGEVVSLNGGKEWVFLLTKQDERQADALIDLALLEWKKKNSDNKTAMIALTNERQMREALQRARETLTDQGTEVTPENLSATATALLARNFAVRTNVIAQTETQESAEATKQIEAAVIAGAAPFILGPQFVSPVEVPQEAFKTWKDMDDSRVRPTHRAVDGTTLPENGIFNVGASRLRFPGDTSLVASAGETINCRCEAQYFLK